MTRHISLSIIKPSRLHAKLSGVGLLNLNKSSFHSVWSRAIFEQIFRDHILTSKKSFSFYTSTEPGWVDYIEHLVKQL